MYPRFNTPAQTPNTNTSKPVKFTSDPEHSTYRWEIWLTKGHQRNSDKVTVMDGYSKGLGAENPNKVELLQKKIVNPLVPYLTRCDMIIVYENYYGLPKDSHPEILKLFRSHYEPLGWVQEDYYLNHWLNSYYDEYIKTGKMPSPEDRSRNVRQMLLHPDLEHVNYNFKSLPELASFCRKNSEKFSEACMKTWYYAHRSYQPDLFENDVTAAVAHAVHTAPTMEAAHAAQGAVAAFQNKHHSNR